MTLPPTFSPSAPPSFSPRTDCASLVREPLPKRLSSTNGALWVREPPRKYLSRTDGAILVLELTLGWGRQRKQFIHFPLK